MTQFSKLDFTGQRIFCGIDVHKNSWSVCLRSQDRELKTFSQDPSADLLAARLKRQYPNAEISLVYEAGFCGFWPQQQLASHGLQCKVAHPLDVPQTDKGRRYKTDAVDCRKLAMELSKGTLNCIYIPGRHTLDCRSLVRTRGQLVKDQTRYKNRILSFLNFHGIAIAEGYKKSTCFSQRFISWLHDLKLPVHTKSALEIKLAVLASIKSELLHVNKALKDIVDDTQLKRLISLLRTIPGIGIISSLVIITEIEHITRFKSFARLASFAGFCPEVYSSGEKNVVKGITRHCHHTLRETLVECAWKAIGKDPALTQAYYELKSRMHYNKAIIRIAKKLLNRVRWVLINQQPYQLSKV